MTDRRKVKAAPPPNGDPLEFIMSDDSVDRMGDVIEADGWLLDNFRKNPIALFGHNSSFPIGKWSEVTIRGNQLIGRLQLMDPVSDRMREVHAAVDAGVLRAVSVGFHPTPGKYEPIEGSKVGGLRFSEQELVECSLVSVPANANALALAKALGISREGRRLIFGEPAEGDQPRSRGLRGEPAEHDPHRKLRTMTTNLSDKSKPRRRALTSYETN